MPLIEKDGKRYTGANGLYSGISPLSITNLTEFYERITRTPFPRNETQDIGLHCTIMYSKLAPKASPAEIVRRALTGPFDAKIIGFEFWEGHDKAGYFVATIKSDQLVAQHQMWRLMGCRPTFEEYKPHMTLAEGKPARDCENLVFKLNEAIEVAGPISVTFCTEKVSDLNS